MNSRDLGLFLARGAVGGTLAAHGFQKLFGMFGGGGLDGTEQAFQKMGFHPARQAAIASGVCEGIGGSMLVIGAATPVAAAAIAGNLAVAASVHRPNGFFATDGGLEFPGTLSVVAAGLALTGPGNLSFDRILKHRYSKAWMGFAALLTAGGVAASLVQRREQTLAGSGPGTEEMAPMTGMEDDTAENPTSSEAA
jgi:putative oxidoreductase